MTEMYLRMHGGSAGSPPPIPRQHPPALLALRPAAASLAVLLFAAHKQLHTCL